MTTSTSLLNLFDVLLHTMDGQLEVQIQSENLHVPPIWTHSYTLCTIPVLMPSAISHHKLWFDLLKLSIQGRRWPFTAQHYNDLTLHLTPAPASALKTGWRCPYHCNYTDWPAPRAHQSGAAGKFTTPVISIHKKCTNEVNLILFGTEINKTKNWFCSLLHQFSN